jgi:hypothetical protein
MIAYRLQAEQLGDLDRDIQCFLDRVMVGTRDRRINIVVVYKVERLTPCLPDFAKPVELFDAHGVSFVSLGGSLRPPADYRAQVQEARATPLCNFSPRAAHMAALKSALR